MNSSALLFGAALLAFGSTACVYTDPAPTAYTDHSPRAAYDQGYAHGQLDRRRGLTHDPHINNPDTVPSAFRKQYVWGYTEGYQGTGAGYPGGNK